MSYNHPQGRPGRNRHNRRPSFVPPPFYTDNLGHDEYMEPVTIMMAEGNHTRLNCLFSRDWPQAFIHEVFAEATQLPIIESVQSFQTPIGHVNCTRALSTFVRPTGRGRLMVQLAILETEIYPHLNLPIIMGRHQVTHFNGPAWPYTQHLQPLVRLDFSPRHSSTFPGAPAMYEPMTAGLSGFHNYTPPPPASLPSSAYTLGQQLQVADFPQAGHSTFASAATAGELSQEGRTRMWVENNMDNDNNAPSGYGTVSPLPPR